MDKFKLGLVPDKADERDYIFSAKAIAKLPRKCVLPVKASDNQGSTGACTAFALLGIVEEYYQNELNLSELYQYYNSRAEDGTIKQDSGTSLRQAMKAYNKFGACGNSLWPYVEKRFAEKPPPEAYTDGAKRNRIEYYRINTLQEMKQSIANGDYVYAGIAVYDSFYETGMDGVVPPLTGDLNGYHAILIQGYEDAHKCLIKPRTGADGHIWCKNSWGTDWGIDNGKFKIPYALFSDIFIDMWSVRLTDKPITQEVI